MEGGGAEGLVWGEATPPVVFYPSWEAKRGAKRAKESSGIGDAFQPFCPLSMLLFPSSPIQPSFIFFPCLPPVPPPSYQPNSSLGPNSSLATLGAAAGHITQLVAGA